MAHYPSASATDFVSVTVARCIKDAVDRQFPRSSSVRLRGAMTCLVDSATAIQIPFDDADSRLNMAPAPVSLSMTPRHLIRGPLQRRRKPDRPSRWHPHRDWIFGEMEDALFEEDGAEELPLDLSTSPAAGKPSGDHSLYMAVFPQAHPLGSNPAPLSPSKKTKAKKQTDQQQRRRRRRSCHDDAAGGPRSRQTRLFICNQCPEAFPTLTLLTSHTIRRHEFYRCTICSAQFTQRSNLQRHSLKHVGFKPFLCRLCTKAYYRKDHLMRHLEVAHPTAVWKDSIEIKMTYSASLDYLSAMMNLAKAEEGREVTSCCEEADSSSQGNSLTDSVGDVSGGIPAPLQQMTNWQDHD